MPDNEYIEYLLELMRPIGHVRARKMFGGYGLYFDDKMFALVADDVLYIKVDDENRAKFATRGLGPFIYEGKGKAVSMNYHRVPDEALESAIDMREWAESGVGAALRAATKKAGKAGAKNGK